AGGALQAMPQPDRRGEVLERDDHADEPVGLGGIVRRSELEHHLVLRPEVECLQVAALAEIPDVERMAVAALEQQIRIEPALHHIRRAPLAGEHRVVAQVPRKIVRQLLGATVDLPAPEHLERIVVEQKDATRRIAISRAERADVRSLGAAMDGMRAAIAGAAGQLIGLDDLRAFERAPRRCRLPRLCRYGEDYARLRWRGCVTRTPRAKSAHTAPPAPTTRLAPHCCAAAPATMLPSGMSPKVVRVSTLSTRPRISSGASDCRKV